MIRKIYLYAPNVHTGGGFVLLKGVIESIDVNRKDLDIYTILDSRIKNVLPPTDGLKVIWVNRSVLSRFMIEIKLTKMVGKEDTILCFHGLPTLFKLSGKVIVFIQNRMLIQRSLPRGFKTPTRIRLYIEKFIVRRFLSNVEEIIVQTQSMYDDLVLFISNTKLVSNPRINIIPFRDICYSVKTESSLKTKFDFVYVSSGDAHKNHSTLISSWNLLASDGVRPKLALTLSQNDVAILESIRKSRNDFNTEIYNLGQLSQSEIVNLYIDSGALIFPSLTESFGLPLLEAGEFQLPILASERDYVRDVCIPTETFDPESPRSIARAVMRFMKYPSQFNKVKTSSEFWRHIVQG